MVKLSTVTGCVIERTPEEAQEIYRIQAEKNIRESNCWKIVGDDWQYKDGILQLKKKPTNDNQRNTGIGDKPPKRNSDPQGDSPQP